VDYSRVEVAVGSVAKSVANVVFLFQTIGWDYHTPFGRSQWQRST